jgi:soluble lytic murein transglycosylase-like protein
VVAQRYAAAEPQLEALCPVYPELEDYCLHDLALCRERSGDSAGAEALWAQLATTHPQSLYAGQATLARARLRRAQGDLATARVLLDTARASTDDDVALEALLESAAFDRAAGNNTAAYDELMEVRRRAPGSPLAREAKRDVEELRQQDPDLEPRGAALENELTLLLKERDFSAARVVADRLLADAPPSERPRLLRQRAEAEIGAGDTERGIDTLQEIARLYPGSSAGEEAQFRYAALLWNRDRDAEARTAYLELRQRYPNSSHIPEAIYALARIAQAEGQTDAAIADYTELADTYPSNNLAHEARWRVGWIYYQQGRWREAAAAFSGVSASSSPGAAADADYWRARALERGGDAATAATIYSAILSEAPASYYSHWAEQRLGRAPSAAQAISAPRPAQDIGPPPPSADPYHWIRARELHAAGLSPLARTELRAFERGNPTETDSILTAYQAVGGYRDAIRLGSARGMTDPSIFFPLAFWPQVSRSTGTNGVDPLLVLALMRQESMFDPAAHSPADARGLMQLLPSTADAVAQRNGQPSPTGRLYDPDTNITLGVAHLSEMLRRVDGRFILVAPAECREHTRVAAYLDSLVAAQGPIAEVLLLFPAFGSLLAVATVAVFDTGPVVDGNVIVRPMVAEPALTAA